MGSPFYDPYGALLDADLNADSIAEQAFKQLQPQAVSLTRINEAAIVAAIGKSTIAFNQVLDLLYPMAWETPR